MVTTVENELTVHECDNFLSIKGMPESMGDLIMYLVELQSCVENMNNRIDHINTKIMFVQEQIKNIAKKGN
jgi:hypothetical protein